ncbi:phage major tail tube protein [Halodesulfovibrio aestuarii]|uniref:Phage major tail tube protein n=1 Tax=Halodesulfovibrio aestuarii TaxID=126333 RepID=A0ABV4JX07_9BACT
MPANQILKNFNLFVDGRGYAGDVLGYTPPKLAITGTEFRAGGMDTSIKLDTGMEALECSFSMNKHDEDILTQFGVAPGTDVPLIARGALQNYGETGVIPVAHTMRGRIISIEDSEWKGGEPSTITVSMTLTYYKREQGGKVLHEIDVINMVRKINGTDHLAEVRKALGM